MTRSQRLNRRLLLPIGRNVVTIALWWVLGLGLVQFAIRVLNGWPASEIGQLLASLVGVGIAHWLRARIAMYFLAGMAAFSASELAIHVYFGVGAAQGRATHFAVMAAAVLGVVLGALLASGRLRVSAAI